MEPAKFAETAKGFTKKPARHHRVIISDKGRKEGPQEGYVLLDKLLSMGDKTPFMFYATSNLSEHKKMARERGAIGSTNRAEELFQTVMCAIKNGA